MKYLKAYLLICEKFCEDDCKGCPFAMSKTGSPNCHSWILHNEEQAKVKIKEYVTRTKALMAEDDSTKQGFDINDNYITKCITCGRTITIANCDLVYDSYCDAYLYLCPMCRSEGEIPSDAHKLK